MKIERLIGIITILQQKGKVTAPYLAKHFEVSRRTINRDIEDICRAGIPIVTTQGVNGGISIMEGFVLDNTVFTKEELQMLLAGLGSLGSVWEESGTSLLAQKLAGGQEVFPVEENVLIDLSSFYKDSLTQKISILKAAIKDKKRVTFRYFYPKGEADKCMEPYLIIFKWTSWYVFGYSGEREDFRLYKLARLWNLKMTDEEFEKKEVPKEKLDFGSHISDDKIVKAYFQKEVKYRLVEEYGPGCYKESEDGRLYTEFGFTDYEEAINWYLGFGSKVEITEPLELRERIRKEALSMTVLHES